MRIISGKYRGMKLAEFAGRDIRPTADRVKESLFNILYGEIAGARALDLFCGSGNLGIECLSRGAEFVHFNDISADSVKVLKENLKRLKEESYSVTNLDYSVCLARASGFDLIFIDPPYKSDAGLRALEIIGAKGILNEDGVAVFERDRPFDGEIGGLRVTDERKYGITYLTFFKRAL
ncbi:MAG: 16S rRNA (guanine(966)-N(2))-methyltransferase RsmD [Clostridia bacterium]|nr:16S rRNA (guanine(966)-N(2))-methyltransferase RsmD [Clostridia bacterium]